MAHTPDRMFPDITAFIAELERRKELARIKDTVDRATETARQRGVFPGTMRELRRRQRLDWPGSDR